MNQNMGHTQKKKPARSNAKRKNNSKSDEVCSASTSWEKNAIKPNNLSKVYPSNSRSKFKKCEKESIQDKKSARSNSKRKNPEKCSRNIDVCTNAKTPKQSNFTNTDSQPSSLSKTPSISTPRSSFYYRSEEKTPCSFYKVTKDEDGKPVFSKSLVKYFLKVDSPEMDDLKKKRWNTSFLRETPKPNREIKIFTEEENNDPKYNENMPDIDSNLPDVPGSLHTDVFKALPISESDEELNNILKEITPVKGPNGRKKRKSTRITCYNGKPLPDEALLFDYSDLLK